MSEKYVIKEVRVTVNPGVELIAEATTIDGVMQLISDLESRNISIVQKKKQSEAPIQPAVQQNTGSEDTPTSREDTPTSRIERNAGIPKNSLSEKEIIAFKDDIPQFLKPSTFGNVTDAALVLIHAVEVGFKQKEIEYDGFRALFESQGLKTQTPLSMLLTNLRQYNYIDKKTYSDNRKIRLTPKGDRKAIEILKSLIVN